VTGEGPLDLVFVPGWISNIEPAWELPEFTRFLDRLASFARLIWVRQARDRLVGLGRRPSHAGSTLRRHPGGLDAAGSHQAALLGWYEGGAIAAGFAATYP
jgi:hypothetical protein